MLGVTEFYIFFNSKHDQLLLLLLFPDTIICGI